MTPKQKTHSPWDEDVAPPKESIDDFLARTYKTRTPMPRPATDTVPDTVFLVIRYAIEFSETDQVLAALTDRTQAQALLDTYERLEASSSGYEIVPVTVHTSAAAALGL